jgi:hypothetical protein
VYKLLFLCELVGGQARPSVETTNVDWFVPDDLPPLSRGRTVPDDIALLLAHRQHPERLTYID